MYDVILTRLQEASLVKDYGGFETKVIAPPRVGMKISPRGRIVLPVAAVVGMLFGCILGLGLELVDDSFRSHSQIAQTLRAPIVGMIPRMNEESSNKRALETGNVDPIVKAYHRPRSAPSEAIRSLRTALGDAVEGPAHVIQITSTTFADGR